MGTAADFLRELRLSFFISVYRRRKLDGINIYEYWSSDPIFAI